MIYDIVRRFLFSKPQSFCLRCPASPRKIILSQQKIRISARGGITEAGSGIVFMLYLTRKVGESVIINDNIEVTVVEVRGKTIKLGFTFPPDVNVLRRELYERIQEENRLAAAAAKDAAIPAPTPSAAGQTGPKSPIGVPKPHDRR